MAFPRLSASMLLASFILLLYWTTSSARSHDLTSSYLSPPHRLKRDLPFRTREEVAASLQVVKDSLSVIKEVIGKIDTKQLSGAMRSLANIAILVPGIGGLVSSFVIVVLAFIPQENPLMELREGFAEVNRKLDSLSIQISNLATDVEWFNYASVYSQDEVRILNAWKKFNEFRENSELVHNENDKLRLAEIFTNYYENTGTEASVANLYHYLTVNSTSLSGNLNKLLRKKFKCGISEISKYNFYFSSLLWKGMVLNQLFWNLIGFNPSGKQEEHAQMFKNVYRAQISAVEFCLNNYEQYMKEDVVEITKALSPDNKTAIADQVKKALDEKYNWYNWVVLVYDSGEDENHILYSMMKIHVDRITVTVGYTLYGDEESKTEVHDQVKFCYQVKWGESSLGFPLHIRTDVTPCNDIAQEIPQCSREVAGVPVRNFVKVMHTSYHENFVQVPKALKTFNCLWGRYSSKISVYFSRTITPCHRDTCVNGGRCKRLLDTNEHLCECPYGWYGDRCEKKIDTRAIPATDIGYAVPFITTINSRLKLMDDKLEKILSTLNNMCRAN